MYNYSHCNCFCCFFRIKVPKNFPTGIMVSCFSLDPINKTCEEFKVLNRTNI